MMDTKNAPFQKERSASLSIAADTNVSILNCPANQADTRDQLCQFRRTVMIAMDANFDQPQASTAEIVSMSAKIVG